MFVGCKQHFYAIERKYQGNTIEPSIGSFCPLLKTHEIFGLIVQIAKLVA